MRLGVLDTQHPRWATALAPAVEHLGYARYWLGEHHGNASQSGSPEVLTGIIAAITSRIRVGPAGVLLRHYSPYKVAQSFRLLEDLFHPRVDLGLARGLGGDAAVTAALLDGRATDDSYEAKVRALVALLAPSSHDHVATAPCFGRTTPPAEIWVLGASMRSAIFAASVGASYGFSDYIARMTNADADGPGIVRAYRDAFVPSAFLHEPAWNVSIAGAATVGDVDALATMRISGPPPMIGTPEQWHVKLRELSEQYETDEFMLLDLCERYADRRRSFELFAEAADLAALV